MAEKILRIFILALLCVHTANAQEPRPQSSEGFVVDVHLNRTQIYSYEPLTVIAEIRNTFDQNRVFTSSWDSAVQVSEDKNEWKTASQGLEQALPPRPYPRDFAPGQNLTRLFTIHLARDRKSLFPSPGTYWVRAWFAGLYSEPKKVEVTPVAREDEAAWQYLRDQPLYKFFALNDALDTAENEESLRYMVTKNRAKPEEVPATTADVRLAEFFRLFPASRYASWARLGLAFYSLSVVEREITNPNVIRWWSSQNSSQLMLDNLHHLFGKEAVERALATKDDREANNAKRKAIQEQLVKLSPTLTPPANARALLAAAEIAQTRRATEEQIALLNQALETKAESDLAEEVALLKVRISSDN